MPIKIEVDLSLLKKAVKIMGAEDLYVLFEKLKKGIVVDLSDVKSEYGLLSYQGHQTILYIQDHTAMFEEAIEDGSKGNRFHVAECQTIERMRSNNQFERYVVTNNQSGKFVIKGKNDEEGEAMLQVCMHCLEKLNYANCRNGNKDDKEKIVQEFHIPIFFETYDSCFSTLPSRRAGVRDDYTDNWGEVSGRYRKKRNFTCEDCGVKLDQRNHHKLLHTHHKNRVKRDNRKENLQALCVYCHSREPGHEHMRTRRFRGSFEQIEQLRQEQGLDQKGLPPQPK